MDVKDLRVGKKVKTNRVIEMTSRRIPKGTVVTVTSKPRRGSWFQTKEYDEAIHVAHVDPVS